MERIAHTFSIVAHDPLARQWGVGVQTHYFNVGAAVPWAEAGVGAVATQSLTERSYGPLGLALMRAGKTADEALRALVAADGRAEVRQVAMIDSAGRVAVHTGEKCIGVAGHRLGTHYAVQANLMDHGTAWEAMAQAFELSEGDLAGRMLQALEAAEAEGGDIRGRQSAALLVVEGDQTDRPWGSAVCDLRVEDHPQPLSEMRRLLTISRLYDHLNEATDALQIRPVTEDTLDAARQAFAEVGRRLEAMPGNPEPIVWYAVELANAGQIDESLPLFVEAFAMEPRWREVLPRLVAAGLLMVDETDLSRILWVRR